jgi:hypothetical protein
MFFVFLNLLTQCKTHVNLGNSIFCLASTSFSRTRVFPRPIVLIQNLAHVWPNLEHKPIPHSKAGGPCYQLMKANDPSATKKR